MPASSTDSPTSVERRLLLSGFLFGCGISGSVIDLFVFHLLLQWHHFYDLATTNFALLSDGLFHGATWLLTVWGLFMFADVRRQTVAPWGRWVGRSSQASAPSNSSTASCSTRFSEFVRSATASTCSSTTSSGSAPLCSWWLSACWSCGGPARPAQDHGHGHGHGTGTRTSGTRAPRRRGLVAPRVNRRGAFAAGAGRLSDGGLPTPRRRTVAPGSHRVVDRGPCLSGCGVDRATRLGGPLELHGPHGRPSAPRHARTAVPGARRSGHSQPSDSSAAARTKRFPRAPVLAGAGAHPARRRRDPRCRGPVVALRHRSLRAHAPVDGRTRPGPCPCLPRRGSVHRRDRGHPPAGVDPADARAGAQLMFYAGEVIDLAMLTLLFVGWYPGSHRRSLLLPRNPSLAPHAGHPGGTGPPKETTR